MRREKSGGRIKARRLAEELLDFANAGGEFSVGFLIGQRRMGGAVLEVRQFAAEMVFKNRFDALINGKRGVFSFERAAAEVGQGLALFVGFNQFIQVVGTGPKAFAV